MAPTSRPIGALMSSFFVIGPQMQRKHSLVFAKHSKPITAGWRTEGLQQNVTGTNPQNISDHGEVRRLQRAQISSSFVATRTDYFSVEVGPSQSIILYFKPNYDVFPNPNQVVSKQSVVTRKKRKILLKQSWSCNTKKHSVWNYLRFCRIVLH